MATKLETGMREETAKELERVRKEVLMAKQELHDRFEQYFCVLRDKLLEMEAQLDEVVRVAETQAMDTQTQLNQLRITEAEVSQNLVHNKLKKTLGDLSRNLKKKIQKLEAIVVKVPSVWLEWSDEWLEGGMRELCSVCEGVSYVHRQTPVWTCECEGEGQNLLHCSRGLVTDKDNGELFVCDNLANRIQVYDKDGNYQRSIVQKVLLDAFGIAVTPHQLFVSCAASPYCVLKLDKLSGDIMNSVTLDDHISGITADTDTLYGGVYYRNRILHLSLEDMRTIKTTTLNSPYIRQNTGLQDLKVTTSLFVVLFHFSNKPIQTFSREGNLVRIIASEEQLEVLSFLCLDRHFNIVVSDCAAHNLKVFSLEGDLIAIIGHGGTGPGEFYRPMGIDVNKDGRIAVVDNKDTHMLQYF